jgi:hypothetical protein
MFLIFCASLQFDEKVRERVYARVGAHGPYLRVSESSCLPRGN